MPAGAAGPWPAPATASGSLNIYDSQSMEAIARKSDLNESTRLQGRRLQSPIERLTLGVEKLGVLDHLKRLVFAVRCDCHGGLLDIDSLQFSLHLFGTERARGEQYDA